MRSELLDITIIGCLVLLFASTYRKRASAMVRSWTLGWVLVLAHFLFPLFHPHNLAAQNAVTILSLAALVLCGVSFLLALRYESAWHIRVLLPLFAGISCITFIALQVSGVTSPLPYYLAAFGSLSFWIAYAIRSRTSASTRFFLIISSTVTTAWMVWSIAQSRQDIGVSAVLTQVYFFVTLVYIGTFRRLSAGIVTMVFGLVAWAAVFPLGEFCDHLGIIATINPEIWNVPKYFVAFGMLLILLEEEIIAANRASKDYRVLFETNPHPMWIYDPESLAFHSVNDAAVAQYGYSREQFLQMTLNDLNATNDSAPNPVGLARHKKHDNALCWVDVATHEMQSSDRNLAFSLVQDVTERQELHQRLLHQANHDLLTGLANRACLEDRLRAALTQTSRIPTQSALLCLDLDRFKQVNDTYGHSVGDICLQQIAQRLKSLVSGQDLAARVGGEEFSLLLHNISSVRQAEHVASDVLLALQAPIHANGYTLDLTASIGIAIFPDDGHDPATLWRNADDAMYRAKRAGGNQFRCMSPEISRLSSEDNAMELQVRRALRYGGLEVYYQPLYKITGELHSLEALVRLNHPELGITLPNRFVPIAEERGLIVPLGSWVINEVCRQMHAWRAEGLPPVHVALNISPLQITRPDFAAQLAATLETHQIDPHWIGIEITETAMMRNLGEAARQIQLLADMGISFSVDDFGTGYSSFGQLDKLPVQRLKTDRSFIDRLCRSDGTYSIVDAIISMAHTLRLQVVAEGVESHEQWECLRQLNCDIVQGFLFSEPLPAAKLSSLIRRGASPRPPSLEPLLI